MPGNGSRHTGKSSGSNRVNEENNGSKVGEHRLCKLWKPALRKRTVSSIKIGRSIGFSLLPYFNWNILYDYIGKDTLFLCGSQAFARFSFLDQLIPKSVFTCYNRCSAVLSLFRAHSVLRHGGWLSFPSYQ